MQIPTLEERMPGEDEVRCVEDKVYQGNRFSAAMQFAGEKVRENQKIINSKTGYCLCYLTSINSFLYALLALKYSQEDKCYTFSKTRR